MAGEEVGLLLSFCVYDVLLCVRACEKHFFLKKTL